MEQSKEYVLDFQRIFFGHLPWPAAVNNFSEHLIQRAGTAVNN